MNKPQQLPGGDSREAGPVFVSYATADRKRALALCKGIERRGAQCWISCRDVEPGENYQEAIVVAIKHSRAVVLVFSAAANGSNEIKKELSLASRFDVPVIALRTEDVEPGDAFAYELSTRQWIDALDGRDKALDALVAKLAVVSGERPPEAPQRPRRASPVRRKWLVAAAASLLLLGGGSAAWLALRPAATTKQATQVRLAGFERLSADLPASMPDAVRDEFVSTFPDDGSIVISTAASAPRGDAPAFALGGTLRHDGDNLRAIARLTDDRTGALIWSKNFDYPPDAPEKAPHWFAVDAASILRCGLSAAASYPKVLPQKTLALLFNGCAADSGAEAYEAASRLVRASPDFSAGWSALAGAAILYSQGAVSQRDSLRREAWDATQKALRLDPQNGDAYVDQNHLLPHRELIRREALLKKAIAARSGACSCAHWFYGWLLWEVGRIGDARVELQRAVSEDPFAIQARTNFAETLLLLGYSRADADEQYKAAAAMVPDPEYLDEQKLWSAPITGDYTAALGVLSSGGLQSMPPDLRTALTASYKAMISGDAAARQNAAAMLQALPDPHKTYVAVLMLAALGANRAALAKIEEWDSKGYTLRARLFLWYPAMRGVIGDPAFPAVAERMGLIDYWRTTRTRPDVCSAKDAPRFCRMI